MECWFPCNFWLKPPAELSREVQRAISVAYSVHVTTADEYQAGTDSAVYIRYPPARASSRSLLRSRLMSSFDANLRLPVYTVFFACSIFGTLGELPERLLACTYLQRATAAVAMFRQASVRSDFPLVFVGPADQALGVERRFCRGQTARCARGTSRVIPRMMAGFGSFSFKAAQLGELQAIEIRRGTGGLTRYLRLSIIRQSSPSLERTSGRRFATPIS